jgi:amyloid beta precursor protein binding protein 1
LIENTHALQPYTHILCASPQRFESLKLLAKYAGDRSIPLFYIQSIGFYSQFSISLPLAFPVVDTHPDPVSTADLRLLYPWPELEQFAKEKTAGLEAMNDHEHGHVPFVLLLLHYIKDWKAAHDGKVPQTYKEKTEFRNLISKVARIDNPEGGEENYDEAVAAVLKSINLPSLSSATREVFEAKESAELSSNVS